jgi:HD-GYP domain-containing protein (c-di-GMP phosphodiesterase class II)
VQVRTAEVVGALGLATDLGMRADFEHSLRSSCIAMRIADRLHLNDVERQQVFYVTPLLYLGCTADLGAVVDAFGDEEAFRIEVAPIAYDAPSRLARTMLSMAGAPARGPARLLARTRALALLPTAMPRMMRAHCEVASLHAERLGLPEHIRSVFPAIYERWDGKGGPNRLKGSDIPVAARVAQVAHDLDVQRSVRAPDEVAAVMQARAGRAFDPELVDAAFDLGPDPSVGTTWDGVLAVEPEPVLVLTDDGIDAALECLGEFAELISPYFRGHAAAVSTLAADTAARLGLDPDTVAAVRRAGLVHDVGRASVPVGIWDRPDVLTPADWERVRLHAYHSSRVLSKTPWLRDIGLIAAAHHERCDGSGYHQGAPAAHLSLAARVLAAADAYCAMTADRPHRAALAPEVAAKQLQADAAAGSLDGQVVDALLAAAEGAAPASTSDRLTPRETEVLRLIAHGRANKQIARELNISAKTVDNHVQRIYGKAGVSTRAAATLWAMQRGLLA